MTAEYEKVEVEGQQASGSLAVEIRDAKPRKGEGKSGRKMSNILISPLGHGLLMPFLSDTNSIAIALHMISDCATFKCKFPNAATLDKIYTLSMTTPETEVIAQIYQMFARLASSTKARHLLRSGMSLSDTTRLSVVTTHLEQLLHPEFPCSEENGNSEQEKEESEESEEEEEGDGKGKGKGKKELNDAAISSQVFQTRLRLLHLLVVNDLASTKNNNNSSSSNSSSSSSSKKKPFYWLSKKSFVTLLFLLCKVNGKVTNSHKNSLRRRWSIICHW
jgi:hypothetical protein